MKEYRNNNQNYQWMLAIFTGSLAISCLILAASSPDVRSRLLTFKEAPAELNQTQKVSRSSFLANYAHFDGISLAQSNLFYRSYSRKEVQEMEQAEYLRLDEQYHLQNYSNELPFCIIVQALNFTDQSAYELTLNSIFNQNYTNYKAIIIHQPDNKAQFEMVGEYLSSNQIDARLFANVLNISPKSMLKSVFDASRQFCSQESISFNIIRNEELLGRNVLKKFNALYQINNKMALIYSNYYRYNEGNYIKVGWNFALPEFNQKNVRKQKAMIATAVTYRTNFLLELSEDRVNTADILLDTVFPQALYFPLIESMCGVILQVEGFSMLAKEDFKDYNDFKAAIKQQKSASLKLRQMAVQKCNETFLKECHQASIITSFSKLHLKDTPELANISTNATQFSEASAKENREGSAYTLPENGLETRAADKYIYAGKMTIAEDKRNFEFSRFDYLDDKVNSLPISRLARQNLYLQEITDEDQKPMTASQKNTNSHYGNETPFCIVISQLPLGNSQFRFEYILNSIFSQNYANYFVVINNRNPMLDKYVRRYLHYYKIRKDLYVYIERHHLSTPLEAIHHSINQVCNPKSYTMFLEGNDELLGRNVLKTFNSHLKQSKKSLIYSDILIFNQASRQSFTVATSNYAQNEKKLNSYRDAKIKFSHTLVFKAKIFQKITDSYLKDAQGQYYKTNLHGLLSYALFELSCGMNARIDGVYALTNSDLLSSPFSQEFHNKIIKMNKFSCRQDNSTTIDASLSDYKIQSNSQVFVVSSKGLDMLMENQNEDQIDEYLYDSDEELISKRRSYQRKRESVADQGKNQLIKLNLKLDHSLDDDEIQLVAQQYQSIRKLFSQEPKIQQPICLAIDLNTFQVPFEVEYTLNSVFSQNYTNYFAVIFGNGSTYGDILIRRYLNFYHIPRQSFVYIPNHNGARGLGNILTASASYCAQDSLLIYLRQNDELIGRNVLKLMSWTRQAKGSLLIYSDHYEESDSKIIKKEINLQDEKISKNYRNSTFELPSNFAFSSSLLRSIDQANFKDSKGNFIQIETDRALLIPLLELACTKVVKIQGMRFLKRGLTKSNFNASLALTETELIKKKAAYKCKVQN